MLDKKYSSLKTSPSQSKREFYKQNFYVYHPLLEQMIEAKLQKCLKYGQLRQKQNFQNVVKTDRGYIIEAPCVMGNQKKIAIRRHNSKKVINGPQSKDESRPKTTNTVIRSRTSEPRIRQKLQYLIKDEEEDSLRPTLNIRRYKDYNL